MHLLCDCVCLEVAFILCATLGLIYKRYQFLHFTRPSPFSSNLDTIMEWNKELLMGPYKHPNKHGWKHVYFIKAGWSELVFLCLFTSFYKLSIQLVHNLNLGEIPSRLAELVYSSELIRNLVFADAKSYSPEIDNAASEFFCKWINYVLQWRKPSHKCKCMATVCVQIYFKWQWHSVAQRN